MIKIFSSTQRAGSGDSFIRVIQKHLADKFSGRLLALLLCELGRQEPLAFLAFLEQSGAKNLFPDRVVRAVKASNAQFEREWRYKPGRSADLAVLVDGDPAALFEIKEDDVGSARNPAQLYASLTCSSGEAAYVDSDWQSQFPSEAKATEEIASCLSKAQKQAKKGKYFPEVFERLVIPKPRT